jgi:DNA replication protein DnaC
MISLKKNKGLNLKVPEFLCDGNLAEHLNKYDMLQNFNGYYFTGFIGRPGSGKTSLLVSMLTGRKKDKVFRKVFNNVVLVMPTTSRNSMKNNIFKKHIEERMFDELDYKTINTIHKQLLNSSEENESTLLILDDVGAMLKRPEIQETFRKIIYNRRHLKCAIIILLQSYMSIPKEIRKLFNNVIMFKPPKTEFINLFEELFETKKELALDIMNYTYKEPHDWLLLNVPSQRLFKGFDEIIVHDPDDE